VVSVYSKLISLKERLEETLQEIDSFYDVSSRLASKIELGQLAIVDIIYCEKPVSREHFIQLIRQKIRQHKVRE